MSELESEIGQRLEQVRERLRLACSRVSRPLEEVHLIAVSKGQPSAAIRAAYAAGQRVFGENYVQELADKADELSDLSGLTWHFLGHLQRNKAKRVVGAAAVLQTLDTERLAAALQRHAEQTDAQLQAFVQVNIGDESQKSGCALAELPALLESLGSFDRLRVVGLMGIAPAGQDPRPYFRDLGQQAKTRGLPFVSMGMSADFEVAVEEGATHVRVGTAIFGPRAVRTAQ